MGYDGGVPTESRALVPPFGKAKIGFGSLGVPIHLLGARALPRTDDSRSPTYASLSINPPFRLSRAAHPQSGAPFAFSHSPFVGKPSSLALLTRGRLPPAGLNHPSLNLFDHAMENFAPLQRFHVAIARDADVTSDFISSKWEIQQLESGYCGA